MNVICYFSGKSESQKLLSKIFNDNLKEPFIKFFNICAEYLEIDIINNLIEKNLINIHTIFKDDFDLLSMIIIYSDMNTISKIILLHKFFNKYLIIYLFNYG